MWKYRLHNGLVMAFGDGVSLSFALIISYSISTLILGHPTILSWSWHIFPLWMGGAVLMRLLPTWGLGPVEELRRITILSTFVYITTGVALLLSEAGTVDLVTLIIAYPLSTILVPWFRIHIKRLLISSGRWGIPVVIYGSGTLGKHVFKLLSRERGMGYNPIALLDDSTLKKQNEIPILKTNDPQIPQTYAAIVAMQGIVWQKLVELMDGPLSSYNKVMVIPELFELPSLWVKPRDINGVLGLEITSNLLDPFSKLLKKSMDIIAIVLAAPLWVPLFLLIALLIWISSPKEPILFMQERVGKNGKVFKLWKFRSMVADAENVLKKCLEEDELLKSEWESSYKLRKDPRITFIGKFLRRLSLDEIPQLFNVIKGEMSLIGPRPLPKYHHYELSQRARNLRERVTPGMTGLWQVSGRSNNGIEGMEQLDSYYVRNWSPWLDMVILVRTMRTVIGGRGAY